jgi:quinolinate synthase
MEEIREKISRLRQEKDAVILAHYYVNDEVQEVADYIGDSFYLSRLAVELPQSTLVLCGVNFMGESAKILNPEKRVLLPDPSADCPMAHMITPERIRAVRAAHPDAAVVCYINSTAELKACSDVCVTSANALKIVRALPNREIYFIPDGNLGRYIAGSVPEKEFIFNDGCCPVHDAISADAVRAAKRAYPGAPVLAHPECRPDVLAEADYIGSTSGILKYASENGGREFIICTECGIGFRLRAENPGKVFRFVSPTPICPDMKLITLEKIADSLENGTGEVVLDGKFRLAANAPLARMLELSK